MNVLVDTNIIIDWILAREKNGRNAAFAMRYIMARNANGFVSAHSISDLYFCIRKELSKAERQTLLKFIVSKFEVIPEDKSDFENVLSVEYLDDLEDGLQIQCANKENLDYIITENVKDFSSSLVPAIRTAEFLDLVNIAEDGN